MYVVIAYTNQSKENWIEVLGKCKGFNNAKLLALRFLFDDCYCDLEGFRKALEVDEEKNATIYSASELTTWCVKVEKEPELKEEINEGDAALEVNKFLEFFVLPCPPSPNAYYAR